MLRVLLHQKETPESEVERLRCENECLRAEVAFLGKVNSVNGRGTPLKFRAALRAEHRLEVLLDVAGSARSMFFYHQSLANVPDRGASLKAAIKGTFTKNHARYGHRRIYIELLKLGRTVAKKTVLKLMRSLRLICKVRSRKRDNSYQSEQGIVAPKLLKRQLEADASNQKWVTDVTEFSVGDRMLYLSPIIDLFDRQIISYAIGASPNPNLANASLRGALATLENGQKPLVHSDQGFQQHTTAGAHSWRTPVRSHRRPAMPTATTTPLWSVSGRSPLGHVKITRLTGLNREHPHPVRWCQLCARTARPIRDSCLRRRTHIAMHSRVGRSPSVARRTCRRHHVE